MDFDEKLNIYYRLKEIIGNIDEDKPIAELSKVYPNYFSCDENQSEYINMKKGIYNAKKSYIENRKQNPTVEEKALFTEYKAEIIDMLLKKFISDGSFLNNELKNKEKIVDEKDKNWKFSWNETNEESINDEMKFQEKVISESDEENSDYANSFEDIKEIPKGKIKESKSNKYSEKDNKNFNKILETIEDRTGMNLSNQEENDKNKEESKKSNKRQKKQERKVNEQEQNNMNKKNKKGKNAKKKVLRKSTNKKTNEGNNQKRFKKIWNRWY